MLPALVCYVLLLLPATPPAQRLSSAVAGYTQNESRKPKRGLHPMSPCPSVFSYEGRQPEDNRWFGVILVTTDEPLTGFWLDVTLDHPAHILGNWDGKVNTKNNINFTIVNLNKKIFPGPPVSVRIFIKFGEEDAIPQIRQIRLNGKQICPSDSGTKPGVRRRQTEVTPTVSTTPPINKTPFVDNKQPTVYRPSGSSKRPSQENDHHPVSTRRPTNNNYNEPQITSTRSRPQEEFEWITEQPLSIQRYSDATLDPLPSINTPSPPLKEYQPREPLPNDSWKTTPRSPSTRRPQDTRPETDLKPTDGEGSNQFKKCGFVDVQPTPLITKGQKTSRGQWPWHTALYQSKGIDLSYICGGSLISSKAVITAAHCVTRLVADQPVDPDTLVVYLGKYHLKLWSEGGVQDKQVSKVHVHPSYNSSDFRADLAILMLSSPVEFTMYVRPVCLWSPSFTELKVVEGKDGTVIGWGYDEFGQVTEELMMAKMPIVSQQTCLWSYPQFFSHFTSNKTYCAGFREGKKGTSVCNGDSGGGMVFPLRQSDGSDLWHLRGLVSISVSQENKRICDTSHYVVFTDIAKYLEWIQGFLK